MQFIIFALLCMFPYNIRNKIIFAKNLITNFLYISLLIIINRNEDNTIIC